MHTPGDPVEKLLVNRPSKKKKKKILSLKRVSRKRRTGRILLLSSPVEISLASYLSPMFHDIFAITEIPDFTSLRRDARQERRNFFKNRLPPHLGSEFFNYHWNSLGNGVSLERDREVGQEIPRSVR